MLVFLIFLALFGLVLLGAFYYGFSLVDDTFESINLNIGDQNFNETYQDTFGIGVKATMDSLSKMALMLLLGMIILMMIVGFSIPKRGRLVIILDIFIIVACFIPAVYVAQSFENFMNSTDFFLDIYSNEFQLASRFVLNLPIIITVIGFLIMVATYLIPKKQAEEVSVYGEGL
jgi:ABC-type Fe3+ transport system permease subunit